MEGSKLNRSQSKYYNTACLMDEALILLLDKKEYTFITVKEICEKAGVNRSTFYLHYETIDDLLSETIKYIGENIRHQYENEQVIDIRKINSCPIEDLLSITPKYLIPYLEFTKSKKQIFKTAYTQPNVLKNKYIVNRLYKILFEPILIRFNVPEKERKYRMNFYLSGLGAVIMEWVKNDCKEDVEEIANIMISCLHIRDILCETGKNS